MENKWIGTASGGAAVFDNENWTVYNSGNSGIPYNSVNDIEFDIDGKIWFAIDPGSLTVFDKENWTVYTRQNSDLPSLGLRALLIDRHGNKWIGTNGGGLAIFNPGGIVSDVSDNGKNIQAGFILEQNFPNPFNPTTKIKFSIPVGDANFASTTLIHVKIYDILGNEIATLVNEEKPYGDYEVEFDASKYRLASGVYFYQLKFGNLIQTKKFILMTDL